MSIPPPSLSDWFRFMSLCWSLCRSFFKRVVNVYVKRPATSLAPPALTHRPTKRPTY